MLKEINVVSDIDAKVFAEHVSKSIGEMQDKGNKVEVQYTTEIQIDGKLLFTAMILGRSK